MVMLIRKRLSPRAPAGFIFVALAVGCLVYLYKGARLDVAPPQRDQPQDRRASALEMESGGAAKRNYKKFLKLVGLITKRLGAASTIFRIHFGYIQCVTIISRFSNVQWPSSFQNYLQALEYFTIDIFSLLPLACLSGTRLGFNTELVITVMMPIISFFFLIAVAMIVVPFAGHPHSCRSFEHML